MSRYDQPSEPDLDRYETRTDDIDVPDFDAPEPPVDPLEHAAHAIIDAVETFTKEIVLADGLDRAWQIKRLAHSMERLTDELDKAAMRKVDAILERRR